MSLSLIISTYNRSGVLRRLLAHLADQTDLDFEVIVAIDGATDDTESVLAALRTPYRLRWVNTRCQGYGLAVARNMGILEAKGDIVAIIDDDSFPVRDYVQVCKAAARPKTISGGPRTPADPSETRQIWKMQELARLPALHPLPIDDIRARYPTAALTECNIFIARRDLIEMGLFSERLKIYGFIGQEFFARASHLDVRYQYVPAAEIVHDRQLEGRDGLNDARKTREIRLASALRDSFMTPRQFEQQVTWAARAASAYPHRCDLPPFPAAAVALFPLRFLRNRAGDVKRRLRTNALRAIR